MIFLCAHLQFVEYFQSRKGSCSPLLENSVTTFLYMYILILVCPFFPHACCYWFIWIVFNVFVSVYFVDVVCYICCYNFCLLFTLMLCWFAYHYVPGQHLGERWEWHWWPSWCLSVIELFEVRVNDPVLLCCPSMLL